MQTANTEQPLFSWRLAGGSCLETANTNYPPRKSGVWCIITRFGMCLELLVLLCKFAVVETTTGR